MKISVIMLIVSFSLVGVLAVSLYFDTEGRAILWEENDVGNAIMEPNEQVVWNFSSEGNQKLWVKFTPVPSDIPVQVNIKSSDGMEIWSSTVNYPMYTTFHNPHSGGTYEIIAKNIGDESVSLSGAATDMPEMPEWLSITSDLAFYLILLIPVLFISSMIVYGIERRLSRKLSENSVGLK